MHLLILKSAGICSKILFFNLKDCRWLSFCPLSPPPPQMETKVVLYTSPSCKIFSYNFPGLIYSAPDGTNQVLNLKQFIHRAESLCSLGVS